jgi:photosystem I P700 chlorophyll a apoprotein A1
MHFHGAYFSNYSAWLNDPVNIKQSSQVVWPIVGQEILNGDVGGNFQGIQTTSGSKCGVQKVSLVKLNYTGLQSVD